MKKMLVILTMVALAAALMVPAALAQASGTVKGTCKDKDGKPITDAIVEWLSNDSGHKYSLKTNAKGEYFSLGITPGKYKVTLIQNGVSVFNFNGVPVGTDEQTVDFDLKKEFAAAQASGQAQMTEEQKAAREKALKENANIRTLNAKLQAARDARKAGDFDSAITQMSEATQLDGGKDILWYELAEGYRGKGRVTEKTDRAAATDLYGKAVEAYNKAIALKPVAAYYNNLGEVYSRSGNTEEGVKAYTQAATLDPTNAAAYYFNMGAVLTNSGKVDEAIDAFKKSIAADPNKAEAYYQLGVGLLGKATIDKAGHPVPAEGTIEAFQKYLELTPTGPNAETAKQMLDSFSATVDTSFSKKKAAPKK